MSDCIDEDAEFYTSTITDAEFLVKPYEDNDLNQIHKYKNYLSSLPCRSYFGTSFQTSFSTKAAEKARCRIL